MNPTSPPSPPPQNDPMAAALTRLWVKYLPEIETRVAVISAAASASITGALTADACEAAHSAAHKLAGSLGTFGLKRGTELARQVEVAFAANPPSATAAELASWASELLELIQNR